MQSRLALLALLILGAASVPAAAQQVSDVNFARGTTSTRIVGQISGRDFRDYVVRAAAGQKLAVTLDSRMAYFNVLPPGSADVAVYNSSSGGNVYAGVLDRGGPWKIRVYQMRASGRRGTVANYVLNIAVTGRAAQQLPGDALVPGTGYNATSSVECALNRNMPVQRCDAGVRRMGNGNAVVEIKLTRGVMRRINFRRGEPVSSDVGPVNVRRFGDMMEIRVGQEQYRFPDAFVLGG